MEFLSGKIPNKILQKIVFENLGSKRPDVILAPSLGEDAAIIQAGDQILAVSSDPITGAKEWLGWLAVHVSANDVATRGIQPLWFNSIILLPKNTTKDNIEIICKQMDKAASELNIAIIGGHCEVTPGITHPIVSGCAIGVAQEGKYVTSSGAKAGNNIILTKGAGLEGTAILASDRRKELLQIFDKKFLNRAENFFEKISIVKEAITAFRTGGVSAMHDPTEGGVAGGLHELADAAKLGFKVYEEKILIFEETRKICKHFAINALQLISSGSLLIITEEKKTDDVLDSLSLIDVQASVIGKLVEQTEERKIINTKGNITELARPMSDHIWKALEESDK